MNDEERRHYEDLRQRYVKRLWELEKREASLGISTPPEISIEINSLHLKLATLSRRLKGTQIRRFDHVQHPFTQEVSFPVILDGGMLRIDIPVSQLPLVLVVNTTTISQIPDTCDYWYIVVTHLSDPGEH